MAEPFLATFLQQLNGYKLNNHYAAWLDRAEFVRFLVFRFLRIASALWPEDNDNIFKERFLKYVEIEIAIQDGSSPNFSSSRFLKNFKLYYMW